MICINSSAAAVAATPYLFGFTPSDSLVVLRKETGRTRPSLRADLPDTHDLGWLRNILAGVGEPPPAGVVLIAYADTVPLQYAQRLIDWVMQALSPVTDVIDVVVVHDGAMHGMFNAEPVPLTELENHPIVAELVAEGMAKLPSRAVLESRLDPVVDEVAEEVQCLLASAPDHAGRYESHRTRLELAALTALSDGADLEPQDLIDIGRACADVFVRDPIVTMLLQDFDEDPDLIVTVRDRLTYAVPRLPDHLAGPTAATLALLAWIDGDGAAALVAAERAMELDPRNTLGPLVMDAIGHGLPPHTWGSLTADIPLEVLRGQRRLTA